MFQRCHDDIADRGGHPNADRGEGGLKYADIILALFLIPNDLSNVIIEIGNN